MSASLRIRVDTFAGGSVEGSVKALAETAARLGLWVSCNVNGIDVLAAPNDNPATLWANFEKARDRKATFVSGNVIPRGAA